VGPAWQARSGPSWPDFDGRSHPKILTNAIKYTNPGGHIEVVAERAGEQAVLRVRDDGVGIVPDLLPQIFHLFAQGQRTLARAEGGLGIGLTLVRRLVELHGGTVAAQSAGPNQGSEFVVRLPALQATEGPIAAPLATPTVTSRARVLVIEDNEDTAEALRMLLEALGHEVAVARDGRAALDALRASVPDVALVDIGLPGMDGYDLARRMRALPDAAKMTLVALTGYGRAEDKEQARAAGFDDHLTKPVDLDALQGLVARLGQKVSPKGPPTLH